MIVFHSFFYKKHPKYLDKAVGMMRNMNGCCFFNHADLGVFIEELRKTLVIDSDGRYEKREVYLYVGEITSYSENGRLQIEIKGGLDYAARIDFINVEKGYCYNVPSKGRVLACNFTPDGEIFYTKVDEPQKI